MTEGPLQNDKSMCVRVWLEVGHACEPRRSALGRALALDWRVWVRGVCGTDISDFVHKVVFHLHPASAFVYPKRVIQAPPYEIQESGCASIEIPIHVYLKHSSRPRRIRLRYALRVESGARHSEQSRCVYYDVENPPEPLWRALLRAGGEVLAHVDNSPDHRLLAAEPARMKPTKYTFVAPLEAGTRTSAAATAAKRKPVEEPCVTCGKELRKQLRAAAMTPAEAARAHSLYVALASYERAADALPLPPATDPIYRVPELPAALRAAASSVEADLTSI